MIARGSALFRQTLLALVGALLLPHLVGLLAMLLLPPHDPGAIKLSDIARQLANPSCEASASAKKHSRSLHLFRSNTPPAIPAELTADPLIASQLAKVLGVAESSVRLAWQPKSEITTGRAAELNLNNRQGHLEETIFLGQVLFARQTGDDWCVGEIPPVRWYNYWQFRITLVLLLSLVALLPLAWIFARRLSRPIGDFATAADAIGRDEKAPLLEEQGPTEMRIAARALNAMQARIQEQLQEREAMIAAIAHDLRTPLSRIAFRVEAASPTVAESVQRDIEQMNAMITATLEFSKESTKESTHSRGDQIIDLHQLLHDMVEDEQAIGHPFAFSAEEDSVLVRGNDVQLNRLFQNLLDNARHFGGTAEVSLHQRDGNAIVEVADRGPGIQSEQIEEMFRPFTRGEPSRNRQTGGMGLGLSITRAIARRHGGEIHLSNRDGGGLLVTVTLPMAV